MLFPDFPLSAVSSTANILIKSKLNPLCGQTNRANLALMTLCDNFIFPWRWIWLGWHRVVLLAMPQFCSLGCKGGLNCTLNPSWFFISSSIFLLLRVSYQNPSIDGLKVVYYSIFNVLKDMEDGLGLFLCPNSRRLNADVLQKCKIFCYRAVISVSVMQQELTFT